MKQIINNNWKSIPGFFSYKINEQGFVINGEGKLLMPCKRPTMTYAIRRKNVRKYLKIHKIVKELFNIQLERTQEYHDWLRETVERLKRENKDQILDIKKNYKRSTKYSRVCHDCGKPTSNYRCKECWERIRSQGKYESDNFIDYSELYDLHIPRF